MNVVFDKSTIPNIPNQPETRWALCSVLTRGLHKERLRQVLKITGAEYYSI